MIFKTVLFLMFLCISQALIFAQVKSIDFAKRSQMVYDEVSKNDMDFGELKKYPLNRISLKGIILKKKKVEFDNAIGVQLMSKRAKIENRVDLCSGSGLALINRFQFRRDLDDNERVSIATAGSSSFN